MQRSFVDPEKRLSPQQNFGQHFVCGRPFDFLEPDLAASNEDGVLLRLETRRILSAKRGDPLDETATLLGEQTANGHQQRPDIVIVV